MNWIEAIKDMEQGKIRVNYQGEKHRIHEGILVVFSHEDNEWKPTALFVSEIATPWAAQEPEWKEVPWWQALEWALGHPGKYIKIQEPGDTEPRLKIGCLEDKTIKIRPIHLRTRHWVPVEEVA